MKSRGQIWSSAKYRGPSPPSPLKHHLFLHIMEKLIHSSLRHPNNVKNLLLVDSNMEINSTMNIDNWHNITTKMLTIVARQGGTSACITGLAKKFSYSQRFKYRYICGKKQHQFHIEYWVIITAPRCISNGTNNNFWIWLIGPIPYI